MHSRFDFAVRGESSAAKSNHERLRANGRNIQLRGDLINLQCFRTFLALAALTLSTLTCAQTFPNRPVRILVPLSPGGGMDTVARGLAQKLGDSLGQQG